MVKESDKKMTADAFFAFLFNIVNTLMSVSFVIFGFTISLWGLLLSGSILYFLYRVLLSKIYG